MDIRLKAKLTAYSQVEEIQASPATNGKRITEEQIDTLFSEEVIETDNLFNN